MASSESNTFEESTQTITSTENMSTENSTVQMQNEFEMKTQKNESLNSTPATQRSASYRGLRLSETDTSDDQPVDDSWWGEIENNDLLLDQVPNVTAVFTPTPEAILEKSISLAESESVLKEENFERLHKIAEKIKMTLSEHAKNKDKEKEEAEVEQTEKERKLSETSDKESKSDNLEIDCNNGILIAHKEQSLEEFKEELRTKRLERQNAVQDLRDEITTLRRQLAFEREVNKRLRRGEHINETNSLASTLDSSVSCEDTCSAGLKDYEDASSRSRHANIELANAQLALQMANSENISLRSELGVVQKQVVTLKEVIACCKQMLAVKEEQCNELKQRLTEIEKSFAERETKIMSDNLRQEYERQLVNIRQLRQLYEERQRVAAAEYENLQRLISIKRDELAQEMEKSKNLEERNQDLMKEVEVANNELACLRDECKEHKFEKAALKEEIGAVNTLFSQMVMGFNGKNNLDIDRLTTMLEENRTLLNDMATKECTDGATLPKLLFELVEQATTSTQDGNKKITKPLQFSRSPSPGNIADITKLCVEHQRNEMRVNDVVDSVTEYEIDNENMAAITSNVKQQLQQDEMPSEETASSSGNNGNTSPFSMDVLAKSHDKEDVDIATTNIDGSGAIVIAQNKNKKHHRKQTTNHKKFSLSLSSAGHSLGSDGAAAATMQELHDTKVVSKVTSAQEIAGNLPKVWRVLMELLSHYKIDPVQFEENGKSEDCYKSVETPNGPKAELSVSKTYIKLKDLILEKKSLVKETNRLKTLNSHLDYRLNEQEKRLSAVSLELTKTWHLVGKMQRQHRQLHTQEQILRYQLQQKRRLLSELKDELEYCRRKWAAARAKNDESQEQCNDLRREFARRKLQDANNSAESGYSDSGGPASDEEIVMPGDSIEGGEITHNIIQGDDDLVDEKLAVSTAAGGCVNYRRKRLREMFEHTRKIKRMQSSSPGRADSLLQPDIVVLRWNSAPPTCSWRDPIGLAENDIDNVDGPINNNNSASALSNSSADKGAIPKAPVRPSRRPKRRINEKPEADMNKEVIESELASSSDDRTCRIQRLEKQCKTLIKQVLETSDNRERLAIQLKRFQDEMSPAQHAVPLEEIINKKRLERMTRASSVPVTFSGCLTPREEEYTRKRSERLERLEEESRQLMSRIQRTSDRGHYLRCSLDRIRRAPLSREGSIESNTEDDTRKAPDDYEEEVGEHLFTSENNSQDNSQSENLELFTNSKVNPLTAEEEAYTARRAARLKNLEEESKQLLTKLSKNNLRGDKISDRLNALHERYKSQEDGDTSGFIQSKEEASVSDFVKQTEPLRQMGQMTVEQRIENIEKISSNREERLRILEEEGRQLISRLSETSERGTKMINRIAERELNRQKRSCSTPVRETSLDKELSSVKHVYQNVNSKVTPAAAALLPTPKNVACSSIVSEELNEFVTITAIPSQIAANNGAIPKAQPTLQLLASRPKSARLQKSHNKNLDNANESLEDMVKRLQSLPFPGEKSSINQEENEQTELEAASDRKDIDKLKTLAVADTVQDFDISGSSPTAENEVETVAEGNNLQPSNAEKR